MVIFMHLRRCSFFMLLGVFTLSISPVQCLLTRMCSFSFIIWSISSKFPTDSCFLSFFFQQQRLCKVAVHSIPGFGGMLPRKFIAFFVIMYQ